MSGPNAAAPDSAGSRPASGCFCMGIGPAVTEALRRLGPSDDVREHFRNARIEVLKGIRTMIDERIASLSRSEPKGTKVVIE